MDALIEHRQFCRAIKWAVRKSLFDLIHEAFCRIQAANVTDEEPNYPAPAGHAVSPTDPTVKKAIGAAVRYAAYAARRSFSRLGERQACSPGHVAVGAGAEELGERLWMHLNPPTGSSYVAGGGEPAAQTALQEHLGPEMVFLRYWREHQIFFLLAARLVGSQGRVVAFEANPGVPARLRELVVRNNFPWIAAEEPAA